MPDEGAPLYLKRVTAIISMCNLLVPPLVLPPSAQTSAMVISPTKTQAKRAADAALPTSQPTNTSSLPPRQLPGVKLRIAPCLYSYRGLASPIMVEDPRELGGELLLPVVLPAGSSCHACFCLDAPKWRTEKPRPRRFRAPAS
ncbi:hypothetical protein J3E68DRAFT_394466 [Trichoderma sp. SZMC 28012]